MRTRQTLLATGLVALLALAGVTAAIAADPAPSPPPRIAFLANGIVPADALAAGPIAGQLGAPVFTTRQEALPAGTAEAMSAFGPEVVVVMGGPVAIADTVVEQVASATGLAVVEPSPAPTSGIVRAAGGDRFETATIVADLLAAYDPAYLPVDLQAADADLLDGMDSSEFLGSTGKAADADLLDGMDSSEFLGSTGKAADADLLDGINSSGFVTKGNFMHNALGAWRANGSGTPVEHFVNADRILAPSQVVSTFPTEHNGDVLALDSVRICIDSGGADIVSLSVEIWETQSDGSSLSDVHPFSWTQGASGCQVLDITSGIIASGTPLDEDKHVLLSMGVGGGGQVNVSATTFHFFRPLNFTPVPFSDAPVQGES